MVIRQSLSAIKRASKILWTLNVGRMHWRNNIIVQNDLVYFSTSGRVWDSADDLDGVHCVNINDGSQEWFYPTNSDANEIVLFGDSIIGGTDAGDIVALDASSGKLLSHFKLQSAVYTKGVSVTAEGDELCVILSSGGEVVVYDRVKRQFKTLAILPYAFRANPVAMPSILHQSKLIAAAESGEILLIDFTDRKIKASKLFAINPYKSADHDFFLKIVRVSSLIVSGDRVIVSYVRDTSDARPPLACFSLSAGKKIWDGKPVRTVSKKVQYFGNSRITPVLWRDQIISTFSYDAGLHAFSLETGKWLWKIKLDEGYFQNWSSPVLNGDDLYVARINGVLSKVDLARKKIVNSDSIEIIEFAGPDDVETTEHGWGAWPERRFELGLPGPGPSQRVTAGICATPAIAGGKIVVGTVSGKLICMQI